MHSPIQTADNNGQRVVHCFGSGVVNVDFIIITISQVCVCCSPECMELGLSCSACICGEELTIVCSLQVTLFILLH